MQELQKKASMLESDIFEAVKVLRISELESELQALDDKISKADFWSNPSSAQEVMKQQSRIQASVLPWQKLQTQVAELNELIGLGDTSIKSDLQKQLSETQQYFNELKEQLKFSGPYDSYDVLLSIHAGAGGTDAQDWSAMLLRMYIRWAEKQNFNTVVLEESVGDEAGFKSVTLEISGEFVYGKLKGEHGVHRLVRLSPFNADNLRQTSFAKVDILPKVDRPDVLEIDDKDLKIDVYRAGGHGGQSVNTTDSAVRITHLPTGITVAIQNERSQLQNKETAMTILRSRLAQLQIEQHKEQVAELKGPNQSAEWGNQIRSYVLHPYKQVKDLRTRYETSDTEGVLDGNLNPFIEAYLEHTLSSA